MSGDAESSAEAQRETPDEPEMGTASTAVAPDRDAGRFVATFVWVMRYGAHLTVASSPLLVGLVLVFDVRVPRSLQIIGLTADLSVVIAGRWVNGQAVDLMGGPQMMWLVDIDLLGHDGADVYTCPTPRWFEWTVIDGQLWWTTPDLAFGRGVGFDVREVAGMWVGSLPDPVLARALEYLRYNREQLEPKTRRSESLEINSFAIARATAAEAMRHVMRMFKRGALPGDGDALYAEISGVLEDFDLGGSGSIFDEDPTEWAPGDGDLAPDPLANLDQRRKQHTTNGESE